MEGFDIDNAINEDGKWETISSEYLFRRPWLTVRHDKVRLPDGRINPEFYVLEYPDWVNIIAITENGEFVMERQYRHGLDKTCYEIAAGVVENGETPLEAARRELEEETGYGGGDWKELMLISGNPSTTSNLTHCFLAEGVKTGPGAPASGFRQDQAGSHGRPSLEIFRRERFALIVARIILIS